MPVRSLPNALVQLIFGETEGVPFFVEEVYRHLAEERRLTDAAGKWLPQVEIGEIEVPETVRLVLGRRIDRIGETAQRILTTAACIGRTFTFEFLAAIAEEKEDDLLDALDEAERARLIVAEEGRQPRFVFAHEQIRQTLARPACRSCAGSACTAVSPTRSNGFTPGTSKNMSATSPTTSCRREPASGRREYLHQAGVSAAARLATPEALAFFARAAELAGPGPAQTRGAANARRAAPGIVPRPEATADLELGVREAAEQGATAEEMEALLRLGRAYYVVGLDHRPAIAQSLQALERARQLAVQLGDRRGEARALIPTHRHIDFDPDFLPQATDNANRALAIARELADEDLEVDALRAAHRMDVRLTAVASASSESRRALERRGDLIALNEHLFDSMWTYWGAAHFVDCIACCDRATALAGRLGIPPVQYGTIKSFALVDLGRFDEAWQALEQEVADDEHPFGQAFQHLGRHLLARGAGDFERVIRDVPRVLADAAKLQRTWMIALGR